MKILLIGALGQLGTDFRKLLAAHQVQGVDKEEIDVCDPAAVDALVANGRPELVINCTAFNRVDDCEEVPAPAFAVNTFAVRHIARACRRIDTPLVHFSTDYVFDGPARHPLTEADLPCPRSMYGVSKLAGEHMLGATWSKHYIVRTCGLYGYAGSREKGTNFVETMLRAGTQGRPLRVVNDQVCTPTSTMDLAKAVACLMTSGHYGLYHLTSAGQCTWYEFARAIFEFAGMSPEVHPVRSDQFQTKARRPDYSVLDNRNFRQRGFEEMRHWREALADYIQGRAAAGRTV
jgi:dTDP-4-dehydrorhamnose reductase